MGSSMFLLVTDVIWELAEKNHESQVKIIAPYSSSLINLLSLPERRVSWENMENMEKMEKCQPDDLNTLIMIQNNLFVPQCTLFVYQITQNTIFYGFNVDGLKNQNIRAWRT